MRRKLAGKRILLAASTVFNVLSWTSDRGICRAASLSWSNISGGDWGNGFQISYTGGSIGDNVVVTTVYTPEPAPLGFLSLGMCYVAMRRRRRGNSDGSAPAISLHRITCQAPARPPLARPGLSDSFESRALPAPPPPSPWSGRICRDFTKERVASGSTAKNVCNQM